MCYRNWYSEIFGCDELLDFVIVWSQIYITYVDAFES